ncbi:hypothetical protein [Methylovulum psychrotolerans]|jgi:hypothetical protein|uniref:Uncharacterized protein n=1 Tax=Methylovulum psychrotolerans TaxID=1704499 RepID=A0A1Z4C3Z8_9GAMM|nr:hypothetical protein [Methylovulum psychrotolerans]ASF48252.1 hypothetical protein CEK71_20505 [Methylovulum psychrotolerans]MBT9100133.1 hypothetical protein [Methylovulum psychrotolerans]POZ52536.1 hypothetical protein AADEFJLK_02021 [Methylovulum psychrotolerans]
MNTTTLLSALQTKLPNATVTVRPPLSAEQRAARQSALADYNAFWQGRLTAKDLWHDRRYWQ